MTDNCAPGVKCKVGSCISLPILVEMSEAYNIDNPSNAIKLDPNRETFDPIKYKLYLIEEFKKRFKECKTDKCWTKQKFMSKVKEKTMIELKKYTFKPEGPHGKFEWLSNFNIDDVMYQYMTADPTFQYLGTVPMDFQTVVKDLKDFDLDKYIKLGKHKYGIIFNLDESWKSGSHWVAMYFDINKGEIYYFDSYGIMPEYRVRKFVRVIANYLIDHKHFKKDDLKVRYNKFVHQKLNSECGVYSMHFIIRLLSGSTFEDMCTERIPDEEMTKFRQIYFEKK